MKPAAAAAGFLELRFEARELKPSGCAAGLSANLRLLRSHLLPGEGG
jgi:hypothetical protein